MLYRRRGSDFDLDALLEFAREFNLQEWIAVLMSGSWPHIIMTLLAVSIVLRIGACVGGVLLPRRKKKASPPSRR